MKDVKNHAMASESHHPGAASVLVVSLKCVLHVAMRLTSRMIDAMIGVVGLELVTKICSVV